ncbi:transglycosylase family protein [Streptomyces sp. NPDC059918]|uniref:transglycosylase family protein n=1 Tax=unclassified Streptomyces TaxID=2593676 RepID=UPI00364B96F7
MLMKGTGRHRRVTTGHTRRLVSGAGVAGAGMTLPLVLGSPASAASVDTWEQVAACESNNKWNINTGNGYYGGLQFSPSTWKAFGGLAYAPSADRATPAQQIAVAEKVLAKQGPQAWPTCGKRAGLTKGGASPELPVQKQETSPQQKTVPTQRTESTGSAQEKSTGAGQDSARYEVRSGDTLSGIASRHTQGTWQELYAANRGAVGVNPHFLSIGTELSLPGGGDKKNDTSRTPAEKPAGQATRSAVAPIDGGNVTAHYGQRGSMWSSAHTGYDVGAAAGTPVKAVTGASVVKTGNDGSFGNAVLLKLDDGRYALYAHLRSIHVRAGDRVSTGQTVGTVGTTGNSTGSHLHFEVRTTPDYGSDIDPVAYLRSIGVSV